MNTNDAVSTDQLVARLAVEVCLCFRVFGAEQSLLERRDEGGHVSGQGFKIDNFVGFEIVPFPVCFDAALAHKPTSATKSSCLAFLAFVAHCLFAGAHFLEGILYVKEVVDVECSLEPWDSARWQLSVLATLWTLESLSLSSPTYQTLQALLTEHVETFEEPRLFVGLQTYPTGDLFLDLLESFLGRCGGFGSHGSIASAADKLERGSGLVKTEASKPAKEQRQFANTKKRAKLRPTGNAPMTFCHYNNIHCLRRSPALPYLVFSVRCVIVGLTNHIESTIYSHTGGGITILCGKCIAKNSTCEDMVQYLQLVYTNFYPYFYGICLGR